MTETISYPPELLTKKQVAYLLSKEERAVMALVTEKKLTIYNDGGRALKFKLEEVRAYINSLPERNTGT
jgi:hypothetical protein